MLSSLSSGDIFIIVFVVVTLIVVGLYFLNRWAARRLTEQQAMVERAKQYATIYVIDKKRMKATEANLPKAVATQLPRFYKFMKMPFVKAKVGPQIVTLMCDKKVFERLPVKKNVKVAMAGIYIVEIKGSAKTDSTSEQKKGGLLGLFRR